MNIRFWNDLSMRLVADDHTGNPILGNQAGPTHTSRAMAMIHLAMHDAVGGVTGKFAPYLTKLPKPTLPVSLEAAVNRAAAETAMALYPGHAATIAAAFASAPVPETATAIERKNGTDFGKLVADAMMAERSTDGSEVCKHYAYSKDPGRHRPDPHSPGQQVLGVEWGDVKPFTYASGAHPPLPPPPVLTDPAYLAAYNDVYKNGRDDQPSKNPQQAMKGIFWAYDGSQKLGTPPRLYNQIVRTIADPMGLGVVDEVRLLTLVNVGMADAGIACWHHKYLRDFWRPVVGVREADDGAGPLGKGDGAATVGDPFWNPLGAPDTNGSRVNNFTPNFPAYPSGHSTFGAACFLLTAKFLGKKQKDVKFDFVSDEFNGVNRDSTNTVRPRLKRSFDLESARDENANSRVYLGVHWSFDAEQGKVLGESLVDGVLKRFGNPKVAAGAPAANAAMTALPVMAQPGRSDPHR